MDTRPIRESLPERVSTCLSEIGLASWETDA